MSTYTERLAFLTRRELEVHRLTLQGKTAREIASDLNISKSTVENYRTRINRKLGAAKEAACS